MTIKEVNFEEGCIACGMCESICPQVFKVTDKSIAIEGVDYSQFEKEIKDAVGSCPAEVIKVSYE